MSDTNYSSANLRFLQSAYVDEAWLMDSLSDDDIDIPKDLNPYDAAAVDGEEDEEEDDDDVLPSGQETWGDLGLDVFLTDLQQQPLTLNSLNSYAAMDAIAASTAEEAADNDNGSVGNNNGDNNAN